MSMLIIAYLSLNHSSFIVHFTAFYPLSAIDTVIFTYIVIVVSYENAGSSSITRVPVGGTCLMQDGIKD